MRTREDIESYIIRSGLASQEVGEDMWLVHEPEAAEHIVIRMAGPMVLFRMKVMELDQVSRKADLYERLLRYNAEEMVHGSYGIADGAVVVTCALRLENLDFNEFQGTVDDFSMALTNHHQTLASYRDAA